LNYADIAFSAQTNISVDSVSFVDVSGELGANQSWDFSNLSGEGSPFSYDVVETASTIFAPEYPNSNFAYDVMDILFFWNGNSDKIEDMGFAMMFEGYTMMQVYSNPKTQIEFPLTYGSSGTDDFENTTELVGFFSSDETGTRSWSVEGYGSLTLPNGTFDDVLLVHVNENSTTVQDVFGTVIELETTTEEYIFYAADFQFPLAIFSTITTDDGFQEDTSTSGALLNTQSVDVAELAMSDLRLAPNPATNYLRINIPTLMDRGVLQVTSLTGQVVREIQLTGQASVHIELSVADLPRGMYLIQLRTENEMFRSKVVLE
jgi:hypothetical protein